MHVLKLTGIGDAIGLALPQEVLDKLQLEEGGTVYLRETPQGLLLTPHDPLFVETLEAGREFIRAYRDTFRAVAE